MLIKLEMTLSDSDGGDGLVFRKGLTMTGFFRILLGGAVGAVLGILFVKKQSAPTQFDRPMLPPAQTTETPVPSSAATVTPPAPSQAPSAPMVPTYIVPMYYAQPQPGAGTGQAPQPMYVAAPQYMQTPPAPAAAAPAPAYAPPAVPMYEPPAPPVEAAPAAPVQAEPVVPPFQPMSQPPVVEVAPVAPQPQPVVQVAPPVPVEPPAPVAAPAPVVEAAPPAPPVVEAVPVAPPVLLAPEPPPAPPTPVEEAPPASPVEAEPAPVYVAPAPWFVEPEPVFTEPAAVEPEVASEPEVAREPEAAAEPEMIAEPEVVLEPEEAPAVEAAEPEEAPAAEVAEPEPGPELEELMAAAVDAMGDVGSDVVFSPEVLEDPVPGAGWEPSAVFLREEAELDELLPMVPDAVQPYLGVQVGDKTPLVGEDDWIAAGWPEIAEATAAESVASMREEVSETEVNDLEAALFEAPVLDEAAAEVRYEIPAPPPMAFEAAPFAEAFPEPVAEPVDEFAVEPVAAVPAPEIEPDQAAAEAALGDDLKSRIEETRRRIREELEKPFAAVDEPPIPEPVRPGGRSGACHRRGHDGPALPPTAPRRRSRRPPRPAVPAASGNGV